MLENEFENKLQQKLEDLQVQPTTEVWLKIKAQVEQKKRKKRLALYFLLVVLLGAGTLFTTQLANKTITNNLAIQEKNVQGNTTAEATILNNNKTGNEVSKTGEIKTTQHEMGANGNESLVQGQNETSVSSSDNSGNVIESPDKTITKPVTPIRKVSGRYLDKRNAAIAINEPEPAITTKNSEVTFALENEMVSTDDIALQPNPVKELPGGIQQVAAETKNENNEIENSKLNQADTKKQEIPVAAIPVNNKKSVSRKWGFAFGVAGGVNLPGSNGDMNKSFTLNDNNGAPVPGSLTRANYSSFIFNKGTYFSAGVQVYRKLSPKIKISTGLEYNYSTLYSVTGSRVDSAGVNFEVYQYGSGVSHKNSYHYLTLPVLLSVKLLSIGNKDVELAAGGSISKLVHSTAIGFSNARGRYVTGANELNKTIFSASANALINLSGSNRPALYIGPQFSYTITPLSATGIHRNRHATFIGLRLQKNIWK